MVNNVSYPLFSHPVLNPKTSLAFISPGEAAQIEATRFLYVSALAAFVWDVMCNLVRDYQLLTRCTVGLPTVVYFVSRIATLAFAAAGTMFYVSPVGSCRTLTVAAGWCWAVAAPTTSLLFFFRARAVFDGRRAVLAVFGILWLATLAGSLVIPFSVTGEHIADTDRCWNTSIKPFIAAGIIASTCNDTLIFIAISWDVIVRSTVKDRARSFFYGGDMLFTSRELVRGGQQYYFITVAFNIVTMVLILTPSTSTLVRAMFPVPSRAMENSMACRVFRDTKLGRNACESHLTESESRPSTMISGAYTLRSLRSTDNGARPPVRCPVVQIRKTTERFDDKGSTHASSIEDGGKVGTMSHSQDPDAYV